MWHEVIASNAPSERYSHSAVLDAEQRMWIFGVKGRDDSDSSSLKLSNFCSFEQVIVFVCMFFFGVCFTL